MWDLGSDQFGKFLSTVQRSFKVMFDLPYATHRYFYEAITNSQLVALMVRRRLISFTKMIENSPKIAPKFLLDTIRWDARSVTGANIRRLCLEQDVQDISEVEISRDDRYQPVPDQDQWRVRVLQDLIEYRNGFVDLDDFNNFEVTNMVDYVCID